MIIRYSSNFPAEKIFGMIGLEGFGPNSFWTDWSDEGRRSYQGMVNEYIRRYDAWTLHFTNLEKSVKDKGFITPLIISTGAPRIKPIEAVPPEIRETPVKSWVLMDGFYGGSRLWIAQKLKMEVPVLINDWEEAYTGYKKVQPNELNHYLPGCNPRVDRTRGILISDPVPYHQSKEWIDTIIRPARDYLATEIFNKWYPKKPKEFNPKKYKASFERL